MGKVIQFTKEKPKQVGLINDLDALMQRLEPIMINLLADQGTPVKVLDENFDEMIAITLALLSGHFMSRANVQKHEVFAIKEALSTHIQIGIESGLEKAE